MTEDIIAWWSGGITSAVTCKLCIDIYGLERCRFIFIDTKNEDDDTYRFKKDCEKWYGKEIEIITDVGEGKKYSSIEDVWKRWNSLNVAHGAICSSELKRNVRESWETKNEYKHQAFGFDINETKRARSLTIHHSQANPIYPLLMFGIRKEDCIKIVQEEGIEVPRTYQLGFQNNNCFKTGCVQGGIGYWQKIQREFPNKFEAMAKVEHNLTNDKGKPVTMLKDQSKNAKESGNFLVFLKPHPKYPELKDLSMMEGREPQPLFECNGFCGTNILDDESETTSEINFDNQLSIFK